MSKVTGNVKIKVNGKLMRSLDGATLKFGGVEREYITGPAGFYGPREKTVPAEVNFKLADMADTDAVAINEIENETIEFICDSGKTYIVPSAYSKEPCQQDDGEVSCVFVGKPAIKA